MEGDQADFPPFDREAWGEMFYASLRRIESELQALKVTCVLGEMSLRKKGMESDRRHLLGMICHLLGVYNPLREVMPVLGEPEEELLRMEEEFRSWHLRRIPYKEYLESPWWQERRKLALKVAHHKCQVCNSKKNLNVHHRTYERLGREADGDLFVLCQKCHYLFHRNGKLARPSSEEELR